MRRMTKAEILNSLDDAVGLARTVLADDMQAAHLMVQHLDHAETQLLAINCAAIAASLARVLGLAMGADPDQTLADYLNKGSSR